MFYLETARATFCDPVGMFPKVAPEPHTNFHLLLSPCQTLSSICSILFPRDDVAAVDGGEVVNVEVER